MKWFIVYQMAVAKKDYIINTQTIAMIAIVRRVLANSKEEAIGKFVTNTKDIEAVEKLEIQCDELYSLRTIE